MLSKRNNYAFIDGQNLYLGIKDQGWVLDYKRFRKYLYDKFGVRKAFVFIGYKPGNEKLYAFLQNAGYLCIFKPTMEIRDGTMKGNVDAELVLHCMIEYPNYEKAIIVSGDGDFRCLAEYLLGQEKLERILVPNRHRFSGLLKSLSTPRQFILAFIDAHRDKLEKRAK